MQDTEIFWQSRSRLILAASARVFDCRCQKYKRERCSEEIKVKYVSTQAPFEVGPIERLDRSYLNKSTEVGGDP
jgi:hypothetical protein